MVAPVQFQPVLLLARAAAADATLFRPGQVLEALVVGKLPDGLMALKIGEIVIQAQLPPTLPPGTTLKLQVKSGGPAPQLVIVGTPRIPTPLPGNVAPKVPLPPVSLPSIGPPSTSPSHSPTVPPPSSVSAIAESAQTLAPPSSPRPSAPITGPSPTPSGPLPPQPASAISSRPAPPAPSPSTSLTVAPSTVAAPAVLPVGGPPPAATSTATAPPASVSPPTLAPQTPVPPTGFSPPTVPQQKIPPAAQSTQILPSPPGQMAGPVPVLPSLSPASTAVPPPVPLAAARPPLYASEAQRTPAAQSSPSGPPLPATPAAALAQMIPEAMARQNSLAPLLASLAAAIARPGALPEPVLRSALQVLGQRVAMPDAGPTGQLLAGAIAKSGVFLEAALARGTPQAADLKSALVALKGAVAVWLGGNPAPVSPARQVPPPLRGMPPRADAPVVPPLPETAPEMARLLHGQADSALSRMKLMQLASLPDADPARGQMPELRTEIPFLIGSELVMAQFQVFRDGARHKAEGKRGWTMRFAMSFKASGEVGAEVGLLGRSVSVALWAADPQTAARLESALPELAPALASLGLETGAVRVRQLPPQANGPGVGSYLDSIQ